MTEIFRAAIERGASDIHVKTGDVVRARIDGRLVPMTKERLAPDQVRALAMKLMPRPSDSARIATRSPTTIVPGVCRGWGASESIFCVSVGPS